MSDPVVVEVAQLSGARSRAEFLTRDLPDDLGDRDAVLDMRQCVAWTASFLDGIVVEVCLRRRARRLVMLHGSDDAWRELVELAVERQVACEVIRRLAVA